MNQYVKNESKLVDEYWAQIPKIDATSVRYTLNNYAVTHVVATHGWQLLIDPPYIVAGISPDGKQFDFTAKYRKEFHYSTYRDINYFFHNYGFPNAPVYRHRPV